VESSLNAISYSESTALTSFDIYSNDIMGSKNIFIKMSNSKSSWDISRVNTCAIKFVNSEAVYAL